MEIRKSSHHDSLEIFIKGRLDAHWADTLDSEIAECVRSGSECILLNMSEIDYISSAGIRVLIKYYKSLKEIGGVFSVKNPSEAVKKVLSLSGMNMLMKEPHHVKVSIPGPPNMISGESEKFVFNGYESFPGSDLVCSLIGDPERLFSGHFSEKDIASIEVKENITALGIGASGDNFEDCRDRFGEFMVIGSTAAWLPPDDSNTPDYLIAKKSYVPEMQVLYSMSWEGNYSHFLQFEPKAEKIIPLSHLVNQAFKLTGSDLVGMAIIADIAGLTGAALKRSPATKKDESSIFTYPEIREWLSCTSEKSFNRDLAVIVGIASSKENSDLAPFLRPLEENKLPAGHFHSAVFSYHTLSKGLLDLDKSVRDLFANERFLGLLHLMNDRRTLSGTGESEFLRGVMWAGPIGEVNKI
jgi:anti-anti-sigma factor